MKKIAGDIIILHMSAKSQTYFFVILSLFLPFYSPLTTWKIKFWKTEKSIWRCHHFTHVFQKSWSYDVCFLRYGAQQAEFLGHFLPLYPTNNLKNQNFEKIKKTPVNYHHFTLVYHKQESYDKWFPRYGAWHIFFPILDHYLPFHLPNNLENQKFEKMKKKKKPTRDIIILHKYTITDLYDLWFLKCETQQNFVILGHFFSFYPSNNPKN